MTQKFQEFNNSRQKRNYPFGFHDDQMRKTQKQKDALNIYTSKIFFLNLNNKQNKQRIEVLSPESP